MAVLRIPTIRLLRRVVSRPGAVHLPCVSPLHTSLGTSSRRKSLSQHQREASHRQHLNYHLADVWREEYARAGVRVSATAGGGDAKLEPAVKEEQEQEEKERDPALITPNGSDEEDAFTPTNDFFGSLPPPTNTKVKTAAYISSAVDLKGCPKPVHPEFAIIGRSNVGKSSLINMLTNTKNLALVSKQPGKTKCINHFLINNNWYLVDLPWYWYAKVAKDMRLTWNNFTKRYFVERETLVNVMLLVDASIKPTAIDIECANWLGDAQVPFIIVFTKVDKSKKGIASPVENMEAFKRILLEDWDYLPPCIATSSRQGKGKGQLLALLAQLRDHWNKHARGSS